MIAPSKHILTRIFLFSVLLFFCSPQTRVWANPVFLPEFISGATLLVPNTHQVRSEFRQKVASVPGIDTETETGMYQARARYYAPSMGRFTTPDPLSKVPDPTGQLISGPNPYSYVRNNPVRFVDPTGLLEKERTKGVDPFNTRTEPDPRNTRRSKPGPFNPNAPLTQAGYQAIANRYGETFADMAANSSNVARNLLGNINQGAIRGQGIGPIASQTTMNFGGASADGYLDLTPQSTPSSGDSFESLFGPGVDIRSRMDTYTDALGTEYRSLTELTTPYGTVSFTNTGSLPGMPGGIDLGVGREVNLPSGYTSGFGMRPPTQPVSGPTSLQNFGSIAGAFGQGVAQGVTDRVTDYQRTVADRYRTQVGGGAGPTEALADTLATAFGDFTGATGLVESLGGIDFSSGQDLSGMDRLSRGLAGGGQIIFTGIGIGGAVSQLERSVAGGSVAPRGAEVVQRAMSRAELRYLQKHGTLRFGKVGTKVDPHFASDAVNS